MKIRKRTNPSGAIVYQLDLGKVGNKRVQVSYATEAEAEAAMKAKKQERKEHGSQALLVTDATRRRYGDAEVTLRQHGATIEDAVAFFVAHHQVRERLTLAELVDRCAWAKTSLRRDPEYVHELKRVGNAFGKAGHADQNANLIKQRDVERWLFGNGWSPKSQVIYLTSLSTIFAWGLEKGHVTLNPCAKVERPRLDDKAPEVFTVAECQALMAAALETREVDDLELLAYVAICLFAGVRMEECEALAWEYVHLEERFIEIPAHVAKRVRGVKRRIIEMSANLAAWLLLAPRRSGKIAPPGMQKRMRKLREAANLKRWPNRVLRHSFASYHLAAHRNAEKTRLDMGHHNTQLLFNTYREVVRPKDAAAFWEIHPTAFPGEDEDQTTPE